MVGIILSSTRLDNELPDWTGPDTHIFQTGHNYTYKKLKQLEDQLTTFVKVTTRLSLLPQPIGIF